MSDGNTTWTYTYDSNGMRTSRTNGTTTYTYVYSGSQLSWMTVGDTELQFTYDTSGRPLAVVYNGIVYYYALNLQGDVVAILNSAGSAVVNYTYDAWGKLLSTTGSLASTLGTWNPLRYRGYVYDQETGLYYLQSRYYNPEWGRFINADALVSTGQGILGNNMFAYCLNNPVLLQDPSGSMARTSKDICYMAVYEGSGNPFDPSALIADIIVNLIGSVVGFVGNTSDSATLHNLKTYGFSFYNKALVLMTELPVDRSAFSFGIIVFDDYYKNASLSSFANTLNHEYGHIEHFSMIGPIDYFTTTAIPSLIGAAIANSNTEIHTNYYNLPWERTADYLGGVNRGYASCANTIGSLFWIYTLVTSLVTPY